MKTRIIYSCDVCGFECENRDVVLDCELEHLGITRDIYREWLSLIKDVEQKCWLAGHSHNVRTEKASDETISALINFEKEHKLEGRKPPVLV